VINLLSILAQVDYASRVKGLQNAFRHDGAEPPQTGAILGFIATISALLLTILIASRLRQRRSRSPLARGPAKLFAHALRQLGVPLTDRLLFYFAVRRCELPQPALVLFSPEILNNTLGRWANALKFSPLRRYVLERMDDLAARAFIS
jgi:hypothetical protein